jgi:uncharacterized membrane protein (DUF441 family)
MYCKKMMSINIFLKTTHKVKLVQNDKSILLKYKIIFFFQFLFLPGIFTITNNKGI